MKAPLAILLTGLAGAALAQTPDPPRSGFSYLTPQTQAQQKDEFANPGMFWVEEGERLWRARDNAAGKSCADCHGDAASSMRGLAARMPAYDAKAQRVINLEQRIEMCRTENEKSPTYGYESRPLLALTAYLGRQSLDLPVAVKTDGPAGQSYVRGRTFFAARRGQLDLSCAQCHDERAGQHLFGEVISQGQINGFPIYRQLWGTLGSTHRMFAWCNEAVRAEPYAAGSQEYVDLELYVRARGNGLAVETPAVRR